MNLQTEGDRSLKKNQEIIKVMNNVMEGIVPIVHTHSDELSEKIRYIILKAAKTISEV